MLRRPRLRYPLKRRTQGFSLVEVLLALFMIALVIGVATEVAGNSVRNASYVKEATFARWVALNQIDRYKMETAQSDTASTGGDSGDAEMGNIAWRWLREVETSNASTLLEVRVRVFRADDNSDDNPVVTVKGYVPAL